MDGAVAQTNLSVFIEVLELGRNLPDSRLILGHQDLESMQFRSLDKLDIKRLSRLFLDKGRFNYRFVQYNSPSPLIMQESGSRYTPGMLHDAGSFLIKAQ